MSERPAAPTPDSDPASRPGKLRAVGLGALAERVYAALLATRSGTAADLAGVLRTGPGAVDRALAELSAAGLVRLAPSDVPGYAPGTGVAPGGPGQARYVACPPVRALGDELRERAVELVATGAAIEELGGRFATRAAAGEHDGLAEVAGGCAAVAQAMHGLLVSARNDVLVLDRQPYVQSVVRPPAPAVMADALRRGVAVRTIYAADAFAVAGYAGYMAEMAALGEQARQLERLPLRFVVVDGAAAMVPLDRDGAWVTAALVVRGPALVQDLVQTFEELWERAGPGTPEQADGDVTDDEVGLLRMLAADMTEAAIARHLGSSTRTVGRRLAQLQTKLGANTRFAMGVEAARRGLVRGAG